MDDMEKLREKIDAIDDQILRDIRERVKICRAIGELKKKRNIAIRDETRETEVFKRSKEKAELYKLDPNKIERLYREIVNICSSVQE